MADNSSEDVLLYDIVDRHIAVLRFNRPQARNAVNGELANAMVAAIERTEADPAIRVVVLTSAAPGMFSAGADLKVVSAGRVHELRPGDGGFAGLIDASRAKPWIAAVDGPALGGGMEMALACDMIVASIDSRFGLPEVKRGLMANAGGVHRIARVLPRNIAIEMVATGDPISAAEAADYGMVNRLVASDRVMDEALDLARAIVANAPVSVQESIACTRMAGDHSDVEMRRISRDGMKRVMATEDSKEGPRAFVEKRAPTWTGR
ncbi:enoyl-CoA hydratase/isomerase family protein [Sphingobium sp. AS12]|uniref:enoyl-CoA hydratase-related protein n=1 Tax=Sphingobium sp. AS12 TaxID=2849495 RepID=UPI001C31C49E|nr:enoyl-CoA hydratase-related protein [Sphingobium sp. AS12]MBV2148099.1 enoyl-CoA hydratase/isomerase family protein [Sphingobium sp. AS12]